MKDSLQEIGKQLIAEGERIYLRDVQGALQEDDSNLAVRRSQEVVELVLKGGLKMLGVDYPKVHDVAPVFSEQLRQKRESVDTQELDRIEEISLWLAQARAPAFYLEHEYSGEDARQAAQDANFVVAAIKRLLDLPDDSNASMTDQGEEPCSA